MTVSKEALSDLKEQYEKAQKLIDEDSKEDPVTEPFRSHYKAREILLAIEENIKNLPPDVVLQGVSAHIGKEIGRIYMFVEELGSAEKYFNKTLEALKGYELDARFINIFVDTLNQASILWSNRDNAEAAKELLERAEKAFADFKASGEHALTLSDLFGTADEVEEGKGDLALEKLHTLTLYYLAQILGSLGE